MAEKKMSRKWAIGVFEELVNRIVGGKIKGEFYKEGFEQALSLLKEKAGDDLIERFDKAFVRPYTVSVSMALNEVDVYTYSGKTLREAISQAVKKGE